MAQADADRNPRVLRFDRRLCMVMQPHSGMARWHTEG